jgi:hypothetical protein
MYHSPEAQSTNPDATLLLSVGLKRSVLLGRMLVTRKASNPKIFLDQIPINTEIVKLNNKMLRWELTRLQNTCVLVSPALEHVHSHQVPRT